MLGGAHTLPGQLALIHHVSKLQLITRMILWPGGRVEPGGHSPREFSLHGVEGRRKLSLSQCMCSGCNA